MRAHSTPVRQLASSVSDSFETALISGTQCEAAQTLLLHAYSPPAGQLASSVL